MSRFRKLFSRFRRPRLRVVWHPEAAAPLPGLPMDPRRAERILAFLTGERLVRRRDVAHARPASVEGLLRAHARAWIDALDSVDTVTAALGTPVTDDQRRAAVALQRIAAGGTTLAARLALAHGGLVAHLGGGLHHATPARGMGFCLVNDLAVAIRHLRHYGHDERILVVDLDLHDGNGTRACFADDPTVHTFSIHNVDWEPAGGVATTSVALGEGIEDAAYLRTLRETLPPVLAAHRPALVFYVAGTDPAADDRLGNWRITPAGMLARDRFVLETLRAVRRDLPVVTVLAGGYGAGAWRYTARFLAWAAGGGTREPPDDLRVAIDRLRAAGAAPDHETQRGDDWGLTPDDLGAIAPTGGTRRVLGRFSPLAIELSLERAGLFAALKRRGFPRPLVVTDTDSPIGDTIRVFAEPDRRELLIELRVARSRTVVPGMELVVAEWLRLQNPRAHFTAAQPRLPGQDHPGLGLLREVVAWVALLCETLELDGLAFTPAEAYLADIARRHLRFLAPDGRTMIYPVSERLKRRLQDAEQQSHAQPDGEPGDER